jgi:hypothetical protein
VRRCGERRCGDGDGGAATAVRREALLRGYYSRGHRSHRSRSSSVHFTVLRSSLLVLQRPRPRLGTGWQEEEQSVRDP